MTSLLTKMTNTLIKPTKLNKDTKMTSLLTKMTNTLTKVAKIVTTPLTMLLTNTKDAKMAKTDTTIDVDAQIATTNLINNFFDYNEEIQKHLYNLLNGTKTAKLLSDNVELLPLITENIYLWKPLTPTDDNYTTCVRKALGTTLLNLGLLNDSESTTNAKEIVELLLKAEDNYYVLYALYDLLYNDIDVSGIRF